MESEFIYLLIRSESNLLNKEKSFIFEDSDFNISWLTMLGSMK